MKKREIKSVISTIQHSIFYEIDITVSYTHLSYGIATGFIFYCIVKVCKGKTKEIHPILWVSTGLFILNFVILAIL